MVSAYLEIILRLFGSIKFDANRCLEKLFNSQNTYFQIILLTKVKYETIVRRFISYYSMTNQYIF